MSTPESPLPWRIKDERALNSVRILDSEQYTVTLLDGGYLSDADRDYIIRAVNAHAALVEALAWLNELSLLLDRVIAHNVEVPISQGYVYDHSSLRTMKAIVDEKLEALRQAEEA